MKNNSLRHAYYTLGLLISIVIIGAVGYRLLGYTPSEAIYQTIITIATVGFEEVHPLDNTDVKLKRADMSYLINPVPETTLQETDKLFALGTRKQIDFLKKTINSNIPLGKEDG